MKAGTEVAIQSGKGGEKPVKAKVVSYDAPKDVYLVDIGGKSTEVRRWQVVTGYQW